MPSSSAGSRGSRASVPSGPPWRCACSTGRRSDNGLGALLSSTSRPYVASASAYRRGSCSRKWPTRSLASWTRLDWRP
ncbi:MAG: hypothetical protein DMD84_07795 [Candidatus Rokuibacteriota bacterium]|nr:MAG: hypothetical protein DMD84_07795 [Candidatus Rokubacteria bacterium]